MKKSIQSLISKLKENADGTVSGGFMSIRGGMNPSLLLTTNSPCDNSKTCSGTNDGGCSNTGNCSGTTNRNGTCTNSGGTCFA